MAPPEDRAEAVTEPLEMWRVRVIAAIVFTVIALCATANAETRDELAQQLADQAQVIDRALTQVTDKLAEADRVRVRRLAAADRLLRAGDDTMASARKRAAARMLVERDLEERRLLADEAARLRAAAARVAADTARVAELALPDAIHRPARGTIARHFGTLVHERSKTTLARRGLDFEVEQHAYATAPADGIVKFAGPIRGLDSGLVIDHGSYLTVVGKLGDVTPALGETVHRGDRLGRAARHRIYLEVRVKLGPGGLPIDPEPLLEREQRKR